MEPTQYLQGKTLAEKQMHYFNGFLCPYCCQHSELIESKEIYGTDYGLMYICRPCQAHVGTHKNSDQALGPLAKKDLRDLRHEAHKYFDPLWKKKVAQGFPYGKSKKAAYTWLTKILEVERESAHIGFCDIPQCLKIISECKKFIAGTPENLKHKETIVISATAKQNIDTIDLHSIEGKIEARKVSETYYDIIHPENKNTFRFNVDTNFGKWFNNENDAWKKVDIAKIIKKHFKKN